jgi:hypothetical protein
MDGPTNKAADRKVILEAADRILGDAIGTPNSAAVQVNINNAQTAIVPGYIIRVRSPEPGQPPKIIGGTAAAMLPHGCPPVPQDEV